MWPATWYSMPVQTSSRYRTGSACRPPFGQVQMKRPGSPDRANHRSGGNAVLYGPTSLVKSYLYTDRRADRTASCGYTYPRPSWWAQPWPNTWSARHPVPYWNLSAAPCGMIWMKYSPFQRRSIVFFEPLSRMRR